MKLIMLIKVYINILEVYNERRSGWSLKQINHLEISSAVYDPILGRTFFTTPTKIKRIRAVVNIIMLMINVFVVCLSSTASGWKTSNGYQSI